MAQHLGTQGALGSTLGSEASEREGLEEKTIVLHALIYYIYADLFYVQYLVLSNSRTGHSIGNPPQNRFR